MTIDEITGEMKRLQAAYPTMSKLDPTTVAAYMQELGGLRWDDFSAAAKEVIRHSKFFPSISELLDAADDACRKRLESKEHEEREERLAIMAAEEEIMDPASAVHRVVVGPNHQKFLDMLSGKIQLPNPVWKKKPPAPDDEKYKPIPMAEREARVAILKQQASLLLKGEA